MENIAKLVSGWSADGVIDLANRASDAERVQIQGAVEVLPAAIGEASGPRDAAVDAWFKERFHKAPVSHNTELFNRLRAATEDLKGRIAAAEETH